MTSIGGALIQFLFELVAQLMGDLLTEWISRKRKRKTRESLEP
jgi:hypothetical protein